MNWGLSLEEKPTRRTVLIFVLLSCLGMVAVFRGALWGEAILAPLDIGPALYSKYQWLDPSSGNVPRNHYLIDMFDYDVPRSYLAHRALNQGEFPWWEPYTQGGRPLIAEAHFGIADPLKLGLLRVLPFTTAFNGLRILQSFLAGLSMFLLLRALGFGQFATVLGALSFQFGPSQGALYYTIPAHSLFYYPLLWLVLHKYSRARPAAAIAVGGVLSGAIIMAGTQQSHVYFVLFLLCFAVAYGWTFREQFLKILLVVAAVFILGCAFAAPVLAAQTELFLFSNRSVPRAGLGLYMLTGVFSTTGIFPWFTGSFRTLDVSKLLEQSGAAYTIYIGTPAMILAVIGLFARKNSPRAGNPEARMAILLVLLYFVGICSTPLLKALYLRSSALAVLALPVLFAAGCEVFAKAAWPKANKVVRVIVMLLGLGVVVTHFFAFAIYPRIKPRVLQVVLERERHNLSMPSAPALREFQVNNLPNEITFKNPEPLLAFLGALALLGFASGKVNRRGIFAGAMFFLNLAPLLIYANRAMPYSPMERWHALRRGGPEQQELMQALGRDWRLDERVPGRLDHAFPGTTAFLYGVHTLHGYSSLYLGGKGQMGAPRDVNVIYVSQPSRVDGEISVLTTNQLRFVWTDKQDRAVSIVRETPNSIQLHIAAGPAGELVRTDTYYPGWYVETPSGIAQRRNAEGFWTFSIPAEATDLVLRYRPSYFRITGTISMVSLLTAGLLVLRARTRTVVP